LSQILKSKKGYKKVNLIPKYIEIEIPQDWEITTLDSLTTSHNSGVFKNKEFYGSGVNIVGVSDLYGHTNVNGQIFRLVRLTDEEKQNHILNEGDLIYCESSLVRTGIGKTLFVTKQGEGTYFAWHTRRLKINKKALPKFVCYVLDSTIIRNSIINRSTTTALTGMTTKDYFATNFVFPTLLEQKKIASILSNIDDLISNTQKIIDQTKSIKKGLMQKLLTKGIGHKKFKKVRWLFGKDIEIPEEWKYDFLEKISNKITDGEHIKPKYVSKGISFITAKNVLDNGIVFKNINYVSKKNSEKFRKRCDPEFEDILLVSRGATVGRSCLVNTKNEFCLLGSVILIKPSSSMISKFLSNLLKSYYIQKITRFNI